MIATAIVYGAIALTGFGCGVWCTSYLTTWRLQKYRDEVLHEMFKARHEAAVIRFDATLEAIRKCMERTP